MEEFLWVEKYRPRKVEECVLSQDLKKIFQNVLDKGELQNMMFTGTAGTGKTTVARALCNELDLDYIIINGSEESGIDTLRNKIKQFASSVSLSGGLKVVILDEADYLNPQSTQPALRGFIEEFSANCRFILTCNFKNRIIEPLHSRTSVIEFAMPKKEKEALAGQFMQRVQQILAAESINSEPAVIAELIMKYFPDFRRTLNELQRYSNFGKIDSGILVNANDIALDTLMNALKIKDFRKMRQWVADNIDIEPASMFRKVYDNMNEYVEPQSIPQLVLILADYQYKNSFVADHELNMVACLTEVMAGVKFK
ncbi:MAG: DNA polymerase [Planctomycetaceae bacterium TMED10]|nr:MAG: DNA polymerase [Planctomycetaceae bacterium TMED10]|tara:strand:+ start:6052 stop:6987 length:936 start_codon:yes stop_codon:yes gene_type:complete